MKVLRYKKGPGPPTTNKRSTIEEDMQKMGLVWEEADVTALDGLTEKNDANSKS